MSLALCLGTYLRQGSQTAATACLTAAQRFYSTTPPSEQGGAPSQYSKEPDRSPLLLQRSSAPFNYETQPSHLESFITPTELFFVRNHLPVPDIDERTYRLRLSGLGLPQGIQELSLPDIKTRFRRHSLAATLQCAGNRRSEMSRVKPVRGLSWDTGAVGTAIWSGALLRDVLLAAGLQEGEVGPGHHVHFIGLDTNTDNGQVYEVSVPAAHVLDPRSSVLLAHEMNGQPLTRDHGFPLRVLLPGIVGARNVKWLGEGGQPTGPCCLPSSLTTNLPDNRLHAGHVMLSETECQGQWQQRDYKAFAPSVDWHNVDWGAAPAIHDCPVQSAITSPLPAARVKLSGAGGLPVRGWAWSGGGRSIIRVDVSADGGSSWTTASLAVPPTPASHVGSESREPGNAAWAWTLWQAEVPVPNNSSVGSQVSLVVKATDSAYNSQPDDVRNIWNLRGVVNNAWHRLPVTVE